MARDYDLDELYANTYTEEDRRAFENQPTSEKKFLVAWALALFLGPIGAQRYYLGFLPTAMLKTLMCCGGAVLLVLEAVTPGLALLGVVGAWTIIDLFLLLSGTMRDGKDHRLAGYAKYGGICAALTVLILVGFVVVAMVLGTSAAVSGS
ncbi:NINE protein [Nesterenkonia massiliensis]|uniref:NINE protein n=1 Tax=Nesterenkonia massiliensis TaxID=1232429 RepID=UPI00041C7675|nr:TM2 domain-containing protein [Nesterenkonia massiliensis]